jgi:hypothetical protein
MAYSIVQQGDTVQYNIYEVQIDTRNDVEDLPTDSWGAGSSCICLEDSSVWMLGNDKKWHELL